VPASETDPPPSGGLSFARVLKEVGALPGLSSADFGAVAAILHQSQRPGGFANASGVGGGAGVARRGGDARDAAPMPRHIPPTPLVPPGGSERQRVYADWHVVGPVRLPSSRYMYVLIR
jgi:hypothetical protein